MDKITIIGIHPVVVCVFLFNCIPNVTLFHEVVLMLQDKRKKFPGLAIPNELKAKSFCDAEDANDVKVAQDALAELEALAPTGQSTNDIKR